jgi:hypothetical protein
MSTIRLEEEGKWIPVIRLKIVEVLRTKPSVASHLSLDPAWVIQADRSAGNRPFQVVRMLQQSLGVTMRRVRVKCRLDGCGASQCAEECMWSIGSMMAICLG